MNSRAARAAITEIRMEIAALQEKQSAASTNLVTLLKTEAELAERLSRREAEIADIAVKLTELEASIAGAEAEIKGAYRDTRSGTPGPDCKAGGAY